MNYPWQRGRRRGVRRVAVSADARALHRSLPVTDIHAHPLFHLAYWGNDLGRRQRAPLNWNPLRRCHWDLPRAIEGGLKLQIFTVYVPAWPVRRGSNLQETQRQLAVLEQFLARETSRIAWAATIADARQINASGRIAAMIAVEGGHSLGGDPGQVALLRDRGVRYLTLVHFADNGLAQGIEQKVHFQAPLTTLGREVLAETERQGMLLDVAHLTHASFDAVCEATSQTLISTHTGVAGLAPLARNLTDGQIDEIARRDGLIGVIALPIYLKKRLRADLEDLADVFCYLAERVGPRYLALGTDFDGFTWTPRGLRGVEDLPALTDVLLRRGFSPTEVYGILGGNAWRVLERFDRD